MRTSRRALQALLATIFSLSLLGLSAGSVLAAPAHAEVLSSDPAIGSTIASAPNKVTVTTGEEMDPDPAKSNLSVYGPGPDATNTLISQGNAKVSLSNPKEMSVDIKPDSAHLNGVYVVVWKTVSADDGDEASGAFTFTVNTNASASTPTPAPTPTTAASTSSTPNNTSANSSSGAPIWVPIVSAVVALLAGLGVGLALGRRRPATSSFGAMRAAASEDLKNEETSTRP
jgi:methionine-rich copper-binding protein CopC